MKATVYHQLKQNPDGLYLENSPILIKDISIDWYIPVYIKSHGYVWIKDIYINMTARKEPNVISHLVFTYNVVPFIDKCIGRTITQTSTGIYTSGLSSLWHWCQSP